jgi:hypothetical protein
MTFALISSALSAWIMPPSAAGMKTSHSVARNSWADVWSAFS